MSTNNYSSIWKKINGHMIKVYYETADIFPNINGKIQHLVEVKRMWLDNKALMEMDDLNQVDTIILFTDKHYDEIKNKIELTLN